MAYIERISADSEQCRIVLDSGEPWKDGAKERVFADWQAAQEPFAAGEVPAANESTKGKKSDLIVVAEEAQDG